MAAGTGKKSLKKASARLVDEAHPGFTEHSTRGKTSRRKGLVYEREVANALKSRFPNAARSFGQSRAGNEVPDVVGTPFWIECSTGTTRAIHAKLKQGLEDTASTPDERFKDMRVAVFSHHSRSGLHMVTTTRQQFIELLIMLSESAPRRWR